MLNLKVQHDMETECGEAVLKGLLLINFDWKAKHDMNNCAKLKLQKDD